MQIFCEHPRIIVNPKANLWIFKYHNYVLDGEFVFVEDVRNFAYGHDRKLFNPHKLGVTPENIDRYGVMTDSGIRPLFFLVPCGHCVLCREKKASEWSFRALCENQTSSSQPLFVTLTYDNKHKPNRGVEKRAIQLFMKRLRRNLDKMRVLHDIRYFACAEYGKNTHRPHYHLILWNFPREHFGTITACLHFVENAWRAVKLDKFGRIVYGRDGAPVTESLGFAYCVNCQKGAISYVMKYMRKDCFVPDGCNDVFFLSSRKNGGIGAIHFKQYIDFYRSNPDVMDFTVTDKFSGITQTKKLPSYFRSLCWPSVSRLVSKYDRDVYKLFIDNLQKRAAYQLPFEGVVSLDSYLIFEDERELIKRWCCVGMTYEPEMVDYHFRYRLQFMDSETRELSYQRLNDVILSQFEYLSKIDLPAAYFVSRETQLEIRRKFMEENLPKIERNLNEVKESIISRVKLAQYKEKL